MLITHVVLEQEFIQNLISIDKHYLVNFSYYFLEFDFCTIVDSNLDLSYSIGMLEFLPKACFIYF